MLSVILGTLNRKENIKFIIENTISKSNLIELVIVDGGSTDGTIEFLKSINHENIVLIEYGKKSSYSHFMNLAIKNSSNKYICQWNSDAILINDWQEVINLVSSENDGYIFNWKIAQNLDYRNNKNWLFGSSASDGWMILDNTKNRIENCIPGEIVMNYGIYNKEIFKRIGRFNRFFKFYFADGDLSNRAFYFGYKIKVLENIKVLVLDSPKSRKPKKIELILYKSFLKVYIFISKLKKFLK